MSAVDKLKALQQQEEERRRKEVEEDKRRQEENERKEAKRREEALAEHKRKEAAAIQLAKDLHVVHEVAELAKSLGGKVYGFADTSDATQNLDVVFQENGREKGFRVTVFHNGVSVEGYGTHTDYGAFTDALAKAAKNAGSPPINPYVIESLERNFVPRRNKGN